MELIPGKIKVRQKVFNFIFEPPKTLYLYDPKEEVPCAGTWVPEILIAMYDDCERQGLKLPDPEALLVLTLTDSNGQQFCQCENGLGDVRPASATETKRAISVRDFVGMQ